MTHNHKYDLSKLTFKTWIQNWNLQHFFLLPKSIFNWEFYHRRRATRFAGSKSEKRAQPKWNISLTPIFLSFFISLVLSFLPELSIPHLLARCQTDRQTHKQSVTCVSGRKKLRKRGFLSIFHFFSLSSIRFVYFFSPRFQPTPTLFFLGSVQYWSSNFQILRHFFLELQKISFRRFERAFLQNYWKRRNNFGWVKRVKYLDLKNQAIVL